MGGVWVCPMPDASLDYRTVTQWAESVSGWGRESDTRGGVLRAGGWGYGQQAFRDILPGAVFFPFRASGNGDERENAEEEQEEEDRRDASSGG